MALLRKTEPVLMGVAESRRYRGAGMSDLLPWALLVESGVVQTKMGAFVAAWFFSPPDSASSTDTIQARISRDVHVALSRFGDGWTTWTDVVSVPSAAYPDEDESSFPDAVSRAVDRERRQSFNAQGAHYDNERVLCIAFQPSHEQTKRMDSLLYSGGDAQEETTTERRLRQFIKAIGTIEDECGSTIGLRRMASFQLEDAFGRLHMQDELLNYLYYCATGLTNGITIPSHGAYLDSLLGTQDVEVGEIPRIGDDLVNVVSIEGFPAESTPNIIAALNTLSIPYRFSQRFIHMDEAAAAKDIAAFRNAWSAKVKPLMATLLNSKTTTPNSFAVGMVEDAEVATALASSGVRFGYYTATIVLRHPEEAALRHMARLVLTTIRLCQFGGRLETTNTFEAWRGSQPGDSRSNVRRPRLHTANLADLLPLSGVYTGSAVAPCPEYPRDAPPLMYLRTVGCIPFRLNFHVSDVGHTLCFGPTGAGKTGLMNSTALQARRYAGMRITVFDNKMGMYTTVKACGGQHIDIGQSTRPMLCPLAKLETAGDLLWAAEFISTCYELRANKPATDGQMTEIHLALKRLQEGSLRSLFDFRMAVQDAEVRSAIGFYTVEGPAGHLLDGKEDTISESDFNVYETQTLMSLGGAVSLPVLLVMFRKFEDGLNGEPTLLYISEAWQALSNPVWSRKLRDWLKRLRSKNCAVIMDTQSLSDAVKSGLLDVLIESCPTKMFLPNAEAFKTGTPDHPGPFEFYKMMGLNENQIGIIRDGKSKRDVYVTSPEGSRLAANDMGPLQLAIAGSTGEKDVLMARSLIEKHGDGWLAPYLKHKGVDDAVLR